MITKRLLSKISRDNTHRYTTSKKLQRYNTHSSMYRNIHTKVDRTQSDTRMQVIISAINSSVSTMTHPKASAMFL